MRRTLAAKKVCAILPALFLLVSVSVALAQNAGTSVGVGSGATAVDPSKNVLDALLAAVTRLNDVINASTKRQDDLREATVRYEDAARDAETRRVNELAAQKQVFDLELARGIRANVDASALLLATQVRELKTDTSDRIAKLEQFANEQRGRTSATDPASAQLYNDVRKLLDQRSTMTGTDAGQGQATHWMFLGLGVLIGFAGLFIGYRRQ